MRCTGGCDPDTLNNGFCPRCKTNRLVVCVACREVMAAFSYTRIGKKSHISSDRHKSNAEQKVNKTYAMWCNPKSFSNVDKLDSWAIRNKWACPPLFGMLQGKREIRAVRDVGLFMSTADWNAWPGEFSNFDSHPNADKQWQAGAKKIINPTDHSAFLQERPSLLVLAGFAEEIAYRVVEQMKAVPEPLRDNHIIPDVLAWHDMHALIQTGKSGDKTKGGDAQGVVSSSLFGGHQDAHEKDLVVSVTLAVGVTGMPTAFYQHGQAGAVPYLSPGCFAAFESLAFHEAVAPHNVEAQSWTSYKLTFFFKKGRATKTSASASSAAAPARKRNKTS